MKQTTAESNSGRAVKAFGASSATAPLAALTIPRREVGPDDIELTVLFCGICHSDLHAVRNEWDFLPTQYPCVPGHEIIGRVSRVGSNVKNFKTGELGAVGCLVDSCLSCVSCNEGLEQYCENGKQIFTYGMPDPHKTAPVTYGGYSELVVVKDHFVVKVPESLPLPNVAPLLCAGITMYSPLKHWEAGPGKKVGIVGLGGLGHMGVKFSHALGAHTVLFTTSPSKTEDGKKLGADEVVVSKNSDEMKKHAGTFDLIVNTVAASHDLDQYINLLRRDGTLVLIGAPAHPHPSPKVFGLISGRRSLAGSSIGGLLETQEMLNFCAEKNVTSDVEIIPIQKVNEAYERVVKSDVRYRFVIDMSTLKN